jgi:hypothetical protein
MGDNINLTEVKQQVRQYIGIRDEVGLLTGRQNELKKRLMSTLEELEPNDNGHREVTFSDDAIGNIRVIRQRKVSKTLDIDIAEDILTKKGIKDTCIKMIPILDEDAIMVAFYEGYLTEADIDSMFPPKESYAFLVKTE